MVQRPRGWSSLTAENEDQAISLVRRFQAAVRAVVSGDQGRIVKFIGDAALVIAGCGRRQSRGRAARAHAGGRRSALEFTWGTLPWRRTGTCATMRGVGWRIQTVAQPGQIVVSGDVWQLPKPSVVSVRAARGAEPQGVEALDLYLVLEAPNDSGTLCRSSQLVEERAGAGSGSRAQERSIAVLPFLNLSSDAENEYFSDGISEEILNALVKVSDLKVASRTSSFGKDIRATCGRSPRNSASPRSWRKRPQGG